MRCSFCQKPANEVRKLIAGPTAFICDACVEVCVEIIADEAKSLDHSHRAPDPTRSNLVATAFPGKAGACGRCGQSFLLEELLPIENRGMLCGGCADAVEDAVTQGQPIR
jgi:hypothetical protein